MAIDFNPTRWMILNCDFNTGFRKPEMVKKRLSVIVSESGKGRPDMCIVVPLSATPPDELQLYQYEMNPKSLPDRYRNKTMWAKCDMIYTVGTHRLDRVGIGREKRTGKRLYYSERIAYADILGIKKGILHGLRFDLLTEYIK